ncbi:MAG TPA: hypothetical protein VK253_06900 [Candidatus Binatia bacterium]|nr:hypothetical protein [Candidatus Binatia bacterium]
MRAVSNGEISSVFELERLTVRLVKGLAQMKVAVKQAFDNVDAIMFEAALALNAIETRYKQKEYVT